MNWPPIMCPRCFGMKFIVASIMAQCSYCGYIISRKRNVRTYTNGDKR